MNPSFGVGIFASGPKSRTRATVACRMAWGARLLNQYFSWRPVLTVDQFWIAALKILPYEISGAYGIVVAGYLASKDTHAVGWLLFAVVALSIFVFYLHRTA